MEQCLVNVYLAAFLLVLGTMLLCFLIWIIAFAIRLTKKMWAAEADLDKRAEKKLLVFQVSLGMRDLTYKTQSLHNAVEQLGAIIKNPPYTTLEQKIAPIYQSPSPMNTTDQTGGTPQQTEQQDITVDIAPVQENLPYMVDPQT